MEGTSPNAVIFYGLKAIVFSVYRSLLLFLSRHISYLYIRADHDEVANTMRDGCGLHGKSACWRMDVW